MPHQCLNVVHWQIQGVANGANVSQWLGQKPFWPLPFKTDTVLRIGFGWTSAIISMDWPFWPLPCYLAESASVNVLPVYTVICQLLCLSNPSCNKCINPPPHSLFSHPRTHLRGGGGANLPPNISLLIEIETGG